MQTTYYKLSHFGFNEKYIFYASGVVFDTERKKEIKLNKDKCFKLRDKDNKLKEISLKKLYDLVFEKVYCLDLIENLPNEIWKPIENTNNKYFISNYGRVKSYCRYVAIILKPNKDKKGYFVVKINNKNKKIHRLVASAFCKNDKPKEKNEVHHKDNNKNNNYFLNLEWLSKE